jgi:[ribosomal protein S5]-alanine N-acetyltransferase
MINTIEPEFTRWKTDDLVHLVKYANNKYIADNLTNAFPHPYNEEDGIKFISAFKDDDPIKVFAIRIEQRAIGSIGIFPQSDIHYKNAETGYWIAEEFWGYGIATKAVKFIINYGFKTFDIERIFARPFGTNIASQRVLEKSGMIHEATLRNTLYKNEKFKDELIYSIRKMNSPLK